MSTTFVPGSAPIGLSRPGDPGLPSAPSVVNQWPISAVNTYGHQVTHISNSTGNTLIAVISLGSNTQNVVPRFNIADDAHNFWQPYGTGTATGAAQNRRIDVWVAPNAMAATLVSVAESWFTSGVAGWILEVANFPTYAQVDFVATANGLGQVASVSGTATTSDVVMAGLLTIGPAQVSFLGGVSLPGFTPLGDVGSPFSFGATDMTSASTFAYINPSAAAGSVSASWNWTTEGNSYWNAILVGLKLSPTAPVQPNPNWPVFQVQAAFGWQPGNLTGTYPTWTDLTTQATDERGKIILNTKRGRNFELDQPGAGLTDITFQNATGNFNPLNAASPYYPNLLPEVPVRVLATIQGRTYPVAWSYASKWPQTFPDPQRGVTPYKGTDTLSAASNLKLPSALAGDVLLDGPYSYHILSEFFSVAGGQSFSNSSRTNLKSAYGVDNTARSQGLALQTGVTMGLSGDTSAGIGSSGYPTTGYLADGGPGVYYHDSQIPSLGNGFSVEFWAGLTTSNVSDQTKNYILDILRLVGPVSNYPAPPNPLTNHSIQAGDGTRLLVALSNQSTPGGVQAVLDDYSAGVSAITASYATPLLDTGVHQYVVTTNFSGGSWGLTVYKDGAQVATGSGSSVASSIAGSILAMGPLTLGNGYRLATNFALGHVATYPYLLDPNRISAHFQCGSTGYSGDLVRNRVARLFAWSGSQLPFAATLSPSNPLIGPADQVQGQSIADALFDLTVDEGGMCYCSADGSIWYQTRSYLYNKPVKWVFGDNVANGECPYIDANFDFSDTYLHNVAASRRTISSSQQIFQGTNGPFTVGGNTNSFGVLATEADQASERQYFVRGPLELDIETTSDQDAYDRANWALVKYRQPQLRANQVLLDPASNPAVWHVALGVEQGDIVTVNRRQIGAAPISLNCIVQQVEQSGGADHWNTILTLAPYYPEGAVIQLDTPGFNTPGSGILPW